MLPLYATRIEDLGQGDFVKVDCAACHHVALLTPEALLRAGLSAAAKVLDSKGGSVPRVRKEGAGGGFGEGAGAGRVSARSGQRGVRFAGPVAPPFRGKERRRVGGHSRRRSPLGLVRPDRDCQARRSYLPAVNEMSAARSATGAGLKVAHF
jgi:hypothetical protein